MIGLVIRAEDAFVSAGASAEIPPGDLRLSRKHIQAFRTFAEEIFYRFRFYITPLYILL